VALGETSTVPEAGGVSLQRKPEPGAPLGVGQADLDAVEALVRKAGTSFYRGMRVLPPDRRHAMYAIYAFCRIVDDIADEEGALPDKLLRLAEWRARVASLYRGEADGPVTRVLVAAVQRFGLREADFAAVIDGMRMDAETVIVAPDLATLDLYCDRVAAAVGRLSVRAFGDSSPAADKVAWSLGRALQLTNILRDIKEDADRGRLYLPAEHLDLAGVPHDPGAALTASALPVVCARLAADAHGHFRAAHAQMALCDPAAMKPARLMGATYAAILTRLEQSRWRDPAKRVSLPLWRKLWLLLRYGLA
jgi:squalene synthase HpnD